MRGNRREAWNEILEMSRTMQERLKMEAASLRHNSLVIAAGDERLRLQTQWLRNEYCGTSHSANVICFEVPKSENRLDRMVVPGENWGEVIAFPGRAD
jgi:hypothetical protein